MKRVWFAVGILLLGFAGAAFAAPFQNGSFESGPPPVDTPCSAFGLLSGSGAISGWIVSVGNIDYVGSCDTQPSNGTHSLDLVGSTNIGGIRQTFDTVAGATYQVSFDLAGNPGLAPVIKPLTVTVAGTTNSYTFDTTGKTALNMGWVTRTFAFTASAATSTINFVSDLGATGTFAGAALDNVSIVRTFAATSTGLFSTPNPSVTGSSVTFTVQIHGTVNSPTGTVDFTNGGSPIAGCTAVPLGPTGSPTIATAECITASLIAGSHEIIANYSGDVLNGTSSNTLVQTVNPPVVVAPTAWTGFAGSVTNQGVPIGSLPSVVIDGTRSLPTVFSDGTTGPAVFTYETINTYCCHTGDWTFETTANGAGDVGLNWTYSGYHGTCQAQASLTAFIRRNGVVVYSAPLYGAADDCANNLLPAGGFAVYGPVVFPAVQIGDTYGFTMHASNFDSNGGVQGRLTVTTGTTPTTTTVVASANPVLYGASVQLTARATNSALEYVSGTMSFTQEGRIISGCDAVPVGGNGYASCWAILPQLPRNIVALYTGDVTNAGSVSSALLVNVNPGPPPASFTVDTTVDAVDLSPGNGICADSQGRCTLRAAAMEAGALSGATTIIVPAGTYVLGLGAIDISGSVTISGAGAVNTIVDGGALDRVFQVNAGVVTISGLTVRNGHIPDDVGPGAGIANFASLTLNAVTVSGNTSDRDGGGIFNSGTLLAVSDSTIADNVAGAGAGIYSIDSKFTMRNSTVSHNHSIGIGFCGDGGAGMYFPGVGQATITNSTIFANIAECTAGQEGRGHAIASWGATTTIRNSILSSPNLGGDVCFGGAYNAAYGVTSLGHNLVGDNSCGAVATDLIVPDPQLYPLGNFGATPTHELLLGSPARDAVPIADCATAKDQEGNTRPRGPGCDIGAVESAPLPTLAATTTTLASVPNPATVGASVTYTATVTTTVTGSDPTGFVDFFNGTSLTLDPACLGVPVAGTGDSRTAVCTTSSLPVGSWLVSATYNGNLANQSSSGQTTQVINAPAPPPLAVTTTTVAGLPNPAVVGANVTFTATVTTTVPGSNPTGTVNFVNGVPSIAGCSAVPLTGTGDSRTASCTTSTLGAGSWLISALYSGDPNNTSSNGATTQVINAAPAIAAPTLIRAIEDTAGGSTFVIGRVDNALPPGTNVQAFTAASCVAGVPGVLSAIGSPLVPVTTPDGYIGATVSGVSSGQFLVIKLTDASGTPISGVSACLPSLGGNDFWTTALLVGGDNTSAGGSSTNDYIDAPGKTRWYKFKVAPGQRIAVTLSGLPADYDLAVFKDIGAAFAAQLAPADTAALTKLSAEFAPSAFSPSAFSPSAFSPSAFSPSAFSPSAFSPSAFSPSAFSPSAFSPSAFSPSAFSPSAFSPSAFSPSAFSPSAFSPSAFSPSAFSPSAFSPSAFSGNADVIQTAFSSAQTRSIIAVSATPGTGDESAVVDSWNNSGYFYARVTGRGGAFSTAAQFNVGVAKSASSCSSVSPLNATSRTAPGSTYRTVILTDSSVLADGALAAKLATFAGRSEIAGVIVDLAGDTRVGQLRTQAAANTACPYATNLLAEEIKTIVDSYRNANLKYVVIVGGDDVVPFFRYPDEALLGPESGYVPPVTGASDASLRGNYVLSQETYGAKTRISLGTSDFPIPGLAVGRLVKTPAEIVGMLDAYVSANGNVQPSSSLVTGYDFLADAATAVTAELRSGTGVAPDTLITPNGVSPQATGVPPLSWRASDLSAALFSKRHDVVFLGGHFSANSALAADFSTNLITSDLAASTTDFTNSIVFSAGCHSGYNIVNRDAITGATFTLDWAQAFAQKKATLIAGTGYQYGDTDFIEYSERLYLNFAKELHAGTGPVAVGDAHVKAKLDYLAATPDIRGIHKKALLESTLYGLPMLGVNMPSGRGGGSSVLTGVIAPTPAAALTPAATLDLRIADLRLNPSDLATTAHTQVLTGATLQIAGPTATWLSGNVDGVVSNPAEPALPLKVVNVTPTDGSIVLRGVGFRGGAYADSTVVPLTGAPATEIRGVHVSFASPYFFPMRPWTINYFGALAGNGATSLLVTPAQHRAADLDAATGAVRSTLRSYSNLDLRLYYSGNHGNGTQQVSLSDAPSIVSVGAQSPATGTATFSAQVTGDPAATIQQVWVVYTNGGTWVPVDLAQCIAPLPAACGTTTDSQIWKGTASVPTGSLQYVVQAANGLGLVAFDDNRGAYYTFTGTAALPQEPAATALAFESAPTGAAYGDAVNVTARLISNGQPVPGATVNVNVGGIPNSGLTDANGRLTLSATIANAPGNYVITASYLGSSTLQATSASPSPFAVSAAPAKLTALSSPAIGVTLTEPVVTGSVTTQVPVAGQSVSFLVTGPGFSQTIVVNTDTAGNATLPTSGLPVGTYSITASFLPAKVAGGMTNYAGATLSLPTLTLNARGTTTAVTASSNPTPVGQLVTLSAAVVPVSPSTRTPTGTVTFKDGNTTLETHPLSGGVASPLVTNALAVGGHSITAVYSGDAWFAGSTSTTLTVTISSTSTTTVLTADKTSPVLFGTTVNLTAAVTPGIATGTVSFLDGSATLGSATLSGGTGRFATSALGIGTHNLTARYGGDANDAASTSLPLTLVVTPAFIASGTMLQPRVSHTATLLNDGRVLVAGGSGAGDDDTRAGRTAEIYCPNPYTPPATPVRTLAQWCPNGAGKFSAAGKGNAAQVGVGNLVQARTYHTATLLPDGTVLLVGGYDASGITTASAEIYDATDPAADKFTAVANLPGNAAAGHTATLITKSGKTYVLVVGGGSAKSWLYDVQAKTWSVSGTMAGVRSSHTASLVGTKVLVAGGTDALSRTLQTTTIYDIATGSFSSGPTMLSPRELHTASVIANGKVLLAGGRASTGVITNTVALAPLAEIYDPTNPTTPFTAAAFASGTGRFGHSASALIAANGQPDGRVFAAGGGLNVLCGQQLATTEFYASGAFVRGGTMNAARVRHSATVLKDGRVLVAGGRGTTGNNCGPLNTVEIWSAPPAP